MERKLEQGLEESMAGSDPVSITQPPKSKIDKQQQEKERSTERFDHDVARKAGLFGRLLLSPVARRLVTI